MSTLPVPIANSALAFYSAMGTGAAATRAQRTQTNLFSSGGKLYTVAWDQVDNFPLNIYQSSDGGATWTALDPTHAPNTTNGSFNNSIAAKMLGTVIYVGYLSTSGVGAIINSMDVSAGSPAWAGASAASPGLGGIENFEVFDFHVTAANTINLVHEIRQGTTYGIYLSQLSGGAWTGPTQIATDTTNAYLTGFFVDPVANVAHITYSQAMNHAAVSISPNIVRYLSISAAGTPSASQTVIADAVQIGLGGFFYTYPSFGSGCVFSGKQIFPLQLNIGPTPAVAVGNSGTWTVTNLSTEAADQIEGTAGAWTFALAIGGTLYIFWSNEFTDGGGNNVRQIRHVTSTDGVTFSAPVTDYDFTLDPPTSFTALPTSSLYDIAVLSLGSPKIGIIAQIENNSSDLLSTFTQVGGAAVPTLVCPSSSAQLNAPYSSAFQASGGTPPYTAFAIIAGALPPGLSLNTGTGLVSGTPTASGVYGYTGQVTDSDSQTATASCQIIVSGLLVLSFKGIKVYPN